MKSGRTLRFLLTLAFVIGQMLALAHATRHDFVEHGTHHCEICTFAHASPVPPAPILLQRQVVPHETPQTTPVVFTVDRRPFNRPNTRGPPLTLA
ncbi:MAG: hypothetical protein P4L83_01950 [Nevskia sp.]|nr:hypothetical protein [Nevskia sp.]